MKLPVVKARKVMSALEKGGFFIDHQTGSHVTLLNNKTNRRATIPLHSKDLKKGTLKNILKQAGINTQEFVNLLKKK